MIRPIKVYVLYFNILFYIRQYFSQWVRIVAVLFMFGIVVLC